MCAVNGSAIVRADGVWEQADSEIHLSADLLVSSCEVFEELYVVGEWCEEREAFHARLKDLPNTAADPIATGG